MKGKLLLALSAYATLSLVAISPAFTLIEPNVIRYTEYLRFDDVPPNIDFWDGPHNDVLQVAPYLDSTNPANQKVCVGWLRTDLSEGACKYVWGSGPGYTSPPGNMYDWWGNRAGITIDIRGHTTITLN